MKKTGSVLIDSIHRGKALSVALIMGIGPIIGMFICMSNCLGDAVVTTVVAKMEGQLDMNILQSE